MKLPCKCCGSTKYHNELNSDGACRKCEKSYLRALTALTKRKATAINIAFKELYERKVQPKF